MTKGRNLAGLAIAATAAALFVSGCETTAGTSPRTEAKIACNAANACKGMSDCKTATTNCAGQNDCKGQGFVKLTSVECAKVTGAGR